MSDVVDQAQAYIDFNEAVALQNLRNRMQATGSEICQVCGDTIPDARRRIVPWAQTCAGCQSIFEFRNKVGHR
jgi:phage/conjugal plasmid C-4 type zinc finger TraR family protein